MLCQLGGRDSGVEDLLQAHGGTAQAHLYSTISSRVEDLGAPDELSPSAPYSLAGRAQLAVNIMDEPSIWVEPARVRYSSGIVPNEVTWPCGQTGPVKFVSDGGNGCGFLPAIGRRLQGSSDPLIIQIPGRPTNWFTIKTSA